MNPVVESQRFEQLIGSAPYLFMDIFLVLGLLIGAGYMFWYYRKKFGDAQKKRPSFKNKI